MGGAPKLKPTAGAAGAVMAEAPMLNPAQGAGDAVVVVAGSAAAAGGAVPKPPPNANPADGEAVVVANPKPKPEATATVALGGADRLEVKSNFVSSMSNSGTILLTFVKNIILKMGIAYHSDGIHILTNFVRRNLTRAILTIIYGFTRNNKVLNINIQIYKLQTENQFKSTKLF